MENNKIVELRSLRKDNRPLMQYIFYLQKKGAIKTYISDDGFAAYCPEEVEEHKKRVHRGRPVNRKKMDETEEMFKSILSDIKKTRKGE